MYVSQTRLPHLLTPQSYFDPEFYKREIDTVFSKAWHFVGTTSALSKPGDFITTKILNAAIQIRNFDGELCALSNVCAHRHAIICSIRAGSSPTMRCQYHGWEYQKDGRTGRIPEPKNFVPFDLHPCLPRYDLATVGQLVFVNLAIDHPTIQEFFGQDFYEHLRQSFGEEWALSLSWDPEYPVNWKVPLENSLEAYHVPAVHPKTFGEDPGDERSEHLLLDHRTAFKTTLPFAPHSRIQATLQRLDSRIIRWLGRIPTNEYSQHHVFPHVMFSFTDTLSLCHCILPTGPATSRAVVRQFGRVPRAKAPHKRLIARLWSMIGSSIAKAIMREDLEMFPKIQSGLGASSQVGMLGRCEERIHSFQEFVVQATNESTSM